MAKTDEALRENLLLSQKGGYDRITPDDLARMEDYVPGYRAFIDAGKTERDCVQYARALAEKQGFKPFIRGMALKPGDRVYLINRGKAALFAVIGAEPLSAGMNIVAAHIDAPRIDLKPRPLYEDNGLAYFKTHYYGGIKKYQWPSVSLELRGVIALSDGRVIDVCVGADPVDPVLYITDLLPHMASDQYKKTLAEAIPAESLNVLVGSRPYPEDEGGDRVKLNILKLLNDKYGVTEADFQSAELTLVPCFNSREAGLDRSFIAAYGHDDRVCAYPALTALFEAGAPKRTCLCVLADKEEIGSEGVTGMQSRFFDTFVEDLCAAQGALLRECFENSLCLSCDVCMAFDPNFAEVSDKRNCAVINGGVGVVKYTGSRGKAGASDASAELVARVRALLEKNDVIWQMAPMGKVDQGGGGTVAMYMANRNIDTLDAGVPVLSMHAPVELVSKLDLYMTHKACLAVYAG